MKINHRLVGALFGALLCLGLSVPSLAQDSGTVSSSAPKYSAPKHGYFGNLEPTDAGPTISVKPRGGGSFGGGGRSFGGGGRSFGGSSGGGSSTGSFGGGSRSFGGSGSSSPRSSNSVGSSSFGRSGSMGSSGPTRSSSISGPRGTSSYSYNNHTYYGYGGGGWGGYSYGWFHPAWYYYTPFYPSFYFDRPYMDSYGYYHAGGFSLTHFLGGICCCPLIFIGIIWMLSKSFGGGKRVKYTSSN